MAEDSHNSHEPRWRNYLRISKNPWIKDHIITGTVLYPGAGMLVMALEGALRTADLSKTIEGFRMNDVMFKRGLVISVDKEAPVETRISFHPHSTKPDSWIFTIYSMTKGSPWMQLGLRKTLLSEADSTDVNVNTFYKNLDTIGMQYGPSFRNVQSLTAVPSKKATYGSVTVPDTKSTMPKKYKIPHVIHPATMDSIFLKTAWRLLVLNEHLTQLVSPGKAAAVVTSWLHLVFLKTSNTTALVVLFDKSEPSINIFRRLKSQIYGPKNIISLAASESASQLMRDTLGEGTENTTITYKWLPESQLLETLAPEGNNVVICLGVPDIAKHAATLATLAPLAGLTYAGQPGEVKVIVPDSKCIGRLAEDKIYVLCIPSTSSISAELPHSVVLLLPESSSTALGTFAAAIQAKLESSGGLVSQTNLTPSGVASLAGKSVISLLEINSPLVYAWGEDQFNTFKTLVSTVRHLFWIIHGSVLESWSNSVEFATTQGLFRVMRNEYLIAILPFMDLSAVADISNFQYADLVLDVWRTSLSEDAEMEYAEGNGLIYIPRPTEDAGFDYELQLASNTAKPLVSALGAAKKPLKASESANTQGYIWIADEQAELPLEAGQVEIKVEYAGVGTGQTLNSVRHAVGIVTRQDDSVKTLQLGQRAIVFSDDAAKTHVRQTQNVVAPLTDGLLPQEAVALVKPLITAQYALIEIARLSYGQALLLDDATSTVGQALVQVAKAVGADI
ncbi:uncharacterized protein ATNIH1004_002897 [Aspergillus tanneri]|uniref:PKS/mFAS DH domain-containing protein n=1 Tax=Aspergillus tanneri TaxID=1220188 RepID=A0A5M9MW95_9EURO|nr:uncharacterized protein ATNIH1004_002897 [Aspergillus tanneri]KAA8650216.1 hypothetical protein ATNIH1004_002897 [Aspergillus tanneri]